MKKLSYLLLGLITTYPLFAMEPPHQSDQPHHAQEEEDEEEESETEKSQEDLNEDFLEAVQNAVDDDANEALRAAVVAALQKGADVNAREQDGDCALLLVAVNRAPNLLKILLAQPAIDLTAQDAHGNTALLLALIAGDLKITNILLQRPESAQFINMHNALGETPLTHAAKVNNALLVKRLLLVKGIDPNYKDLQGMTALHYAVQHGDAPSIKTLLADPRIKPFIQNNAGLTPLELAAMLLSLSGVQELLKTPHSLELLDKTFQLIQSNYLSPRMSGAILKRANSILELLEEAVDLSDQEKKAKREHYQVKRRKTAPAT